MTEKLTPSVRIALLEPLDARLLLSTTALPGGLSWPAGIIDIAELGKSAVIENLGKGKKPDESLAGDFNGDTLVNDKDIDLLSMEMRAVSEDPSTGDPWYDLDKDGDVDLADHDFLVINIIGTGLGDANLDWSVDVDDLNLWKVSRFQTGTGWGTGDFDGDGDTDTNDLNIWKSNRFTSFVPDPDPTPDPAPGEEVTWRTEVTADGLRLVVLGTDGPDAITVSRSGSATIIISAEGTDYLTDNITSVQVYGFGGDDLLVTISGAAEAVYGGAGLDSFWIDSLDTIVDVEAAETDWNVHQVSEFYQPTSDPGEYVSLEIAGQDIVDPQADYAYVDFSESPLFVDGPEYDDMAQGAAGDCYLLAALGSVAMSDPTIIEQMIAPLGDGSYAVRFFSSGQASYVRIDSDLPSYAYSRLAYAHQTPDGEIWVALVEKAYAQFRYGLNSYASLDGGEMVIPYIQITNSAAQKSNLFLFSDDGLVDYITAQLQDGHALSAGSFSNADAPITPSHAYVITSIQYDQDQWYVTVYNVWGNDGILDDDDFLDGLVTLSLDQFRLNFSQLTVCLA